MHLRRSFLLLALLAAPGSKHAAATQVIEMDLPELARQADRIVVAEVKAVQAAWDRARVRILSTIELEVSETWKGSPRSRLTIIQPGGSVGDMEMRVHGLPDFTPGERAVLFLRGKRVSSLVGLGQGKHPLRFDPDSRRWLAAAPDRSAAVTRALEGHPAKPAPEAGVPLDELRLRVRAALKR